VRRDGKTLAKFLSPPGAAEPEKKTPVQGRLIFFKVSAQLYTLAKEKACCRQVSLQDLMVDALEKACRKKGEKGK
jgi:hypothetical protein